MEPATAAARLKGMTGLRGLVRGLSLLSGLSLLMVAAACGQGTGAGPGGSAPDSYAADDLVLRVEYTGGFVPPNFLVARLPLISVYGDGRVITEGPVPAIYPGPALPNVQVQKISAEGVRTLVARAEAAGVGRLPDLGEPAVADAPWTRISVVTKEGVKVTKAYALAEAGGADSGLTPAQRAARADLQEFVNGLTDLPRTLGANAVGESAQYVPTAVAAVSSPWTRPTDENVPTTQLPWPGPQLPGEPVFEALDLSCLVATGEPAQKVLEAAKSATSITPWTSGGKAWSVSLRPLLPDETSCADLKPKD